MKRRSKSQWLHRGALPSTSPPILSRIPPQMGTEKKKMEEDEEGEAEDGETEDGVGRQSIPRGV